jgi:hypothetical protein
VGDRRAVLHVGFGIPCGQATLAEETQFIFGHRALQPKQQPVVDQARVVDSVVVDEEGGHEGAEIDQVMPVAAVACQARRLETEDRPDRAGAYASDEALESWPCHQSRPRPPEILVDRLDVREPQGPRRLCQRVLAPLALKVIAHLHECGLPHVDDGGAPEVLRTDLRTHRAPPGSGRRRR